MENTVNAKRYFARIVIEAVTPLAIGSGNRNMISDRLVLLDVNGLPYIPATSLAGVLRHSLSLSESEIDKIFGYQKGDKGEGSRLLFSSANLVGHDGKVIDGLIKREKLSEPFYQMFENLPVRQHVKISHRGAAVDGAKFDEQVVFKGTRFCFEMELKGEESDREKWNTILDQLNDPAFRIGGGTRKGFGEIKVVEYRERRLDISPGNGLTDLLEKSSDLSDPGRWWENASPVEPKRPDNAAWINYTLELEPEDFFLFSSGLESENADMTFVNEDVIEWKEGRPQSPTKKMIFIPSTSLKGAIAHRLAYHYNKLNGITIEMLKSEERVETLLKNGFKLPEKKKFDSQNFNDILDWVSNNNPAVIELFGKADEKENGSGIKRGKVLFSDFYFDKKLPEKLLNHVSIDRFTGGAIQGALFSEEVVYGKGQKAKLNILVHKSAFKGSGAPERETIMQAFEQTLDDICTGMLPLGGGTMRGHGTFTGKVLKDGKELNNE